MQLLVFIVACAGGVVGAMVYEYVRSQDIWKE